MSVESADKPKRRAAGKKDQAGVNAPKERGPERNISLTRRFRDKVIIGITLLALVSYTNSFFGDFVFDDIPAIVNNGDVRGTTPILNMFDNDFWGQNMLSNRSHHSYRPLTTLSFRATHAMFGLTPFPFHVVNVILHVINSLLFFFACEVLIHSRSAKSAFVSSALAGAFFAAHPIHTEAVSSIVGRAELLSAFFALVGFRAYVCAARVQETDIKWLVVAILSAVAAMLCKEQGITIAALYFAYDLLYPNRTHIWHYLSAGAYKKEVQTMLRRLGSMGLVVFAAIVWRVNLNGAAPANILPEENPAGFASSLKTRVLTWNYLLSVNAWLLLAPSRLLCDYSHDTIPLVTSFFDVRNLATVFFYAVFFAIVMYAVKRAVPSQKRFIGRQNVSWLMAVAFLVFPFLPCTNLFFMVGFVVAERVLYLPSAGYAMLLGLALDRPRHTGRCRLRTVLAVGALIVAVYWLRSLGRNRDWRTGIRLWRSALRVAPTNPKVYNGLGQAMVERGGEWFDDGLVYLEKATNMRPKYASAYYNLGTALATQGNYKQARNAFKYALAADANHTDALYNQGLTLYKLGKYDSSAYHFEKLLDLQPKRVDAYFNMGAALHALGEYGEAVDSYAWAMHLDPLSPQHVTNYGLSKAAQGDSMEAERAFRHALVLNPDDVPALTALGVHLGRNERYAEAEAELLQAAQLAPDDDNVAHHLEITRRIMQGDDDAFYDEAATATPPATPPPAEDYAGNDHADYAEPLEEHTDAPAYEPHGDGQRVHAGANDHHVLDVAVDEQEPDAYDDPKYDGEEDMAQAPSPAPAPKAQQQYRDDHDDWAEDGAGTSDASEQQDWAQDVDNNDWD